MIKSLSRRSFMLGAAGLLTTVSCARADCENPPVFKKISVLEAHKLLIENKIVLIDIRRPDEWRKTGIPQGSVPIDMRDPDFLRFVDAARGAERLPVALICARGGRSAHVARVMTSSCYGEGRIFYDVTEGMLGSWSGPGWLARDLPVDDYAQ